MLALAPPLPPRRQPPPTTGCVCPPCRPSLANLLTALGLLTALVVLVARLDRGSGAGACLTGRSAADGAAAAAAPARGVLSTAFGGVRRFSLPGSFERVFPSLGNGSVAGVLHLYLKAALVGGDTRMKGVAVFEFVDYPRHYTQRDIHKDAGILTVPEMRALRLGVRSAAGGWERAVAVEWQCGLEWRPRERRPPPCVAAEQNGSKPYLRMPDVYHDFGRLRDSDVELFVHGWPRYVSLAPLLAAAAPAPVDPLRPPPEPAATVQLLPYPRGLPAGFVAQLLAWRAEHHVPLGIHTTYMYVQPWDEEALAAQPAVRSLAAAGQLRLVSWAEFAGYRDWSVYDLTVQAAHGVLSFWATDTRVWVADLDEFLVTPLAGVPAVLSSPACRPRPAGCYTMYRYNVVLPPGPDGTARDEAALWRAPGPSPLLAQYQRALAYTDFIPPKSFVDPNSVTPVTLHFSTACTGGNGTASPCAVQLACAPVRQQCAWVAHFREMFTQRKPLPAVKPTAALTPGWHRWANQTPFWEAPEAR